MDTTTPKEEQQPKEEPKPKEETKDVNTTPEKSTTYTDIYFKVKKDNFYLFDEEDYLIFGV